MMGPGGGPQTFGARLGNRVLDVGRGVGLVLVDQAVGGRFGVDVGLGVADQALDLMHVRRQDLGGFGRGEALKRRQQEGLTRARGDAHQAARGVVAGLQAAGVLQPGARGGPDGVEDMIEGHAGRHFRGQLALAGGEGFQRDADIVVAGGLIAGQRAGVTADVGQMRRKAGQQAH